MREGIAAGIVGGGIREGRDRGRRWVMEKNGVSGKGNKKRN